MQSLLTYQDVGAMLRVSRNTVMRMVARGELPAVRLGRQIRFVPADIERYIDSARTVATLRTDGLLPHQAALMRK